MNMRLDDCRRFCLFLALFIITGTVTVSAISAQDAGSPPIPEREYKRVHQNALSQIESGKIDQALDALRKHDKEFPGDPETSYMLAIGHAVKSNTQLMLKHANRALERGLPPGRFLAGPHTLLKPLQQTPLWKELLADKQLVARDFVIHGPMLGDITPTSIKVWLRTAQADHEVKIHLAPTSSPKTIKTYKHKATGANSDFTQTITLDALSPDTQYIYFVGQVRDKPDGQFKTPPAPRKGARFSFAFGGGSGYVPPNERMWDTINAKNPTLLLLLGDNVYSDKPESTNMQRYCYYRRQSRPEFARLVSSVPVYTIWDDHDFGTNDCWGGPDITDPPWKPQVYRTYRENWVNPYYGGGDKQPGIYYHFTYADVDFIMLDGRYYREKPKGAQNPSMLGPVQLKWLKERLKAAKGILKVIASPVPWDYRTKGGSLDTWNGFQKEREEVFSFIEKNKIDGVFLISADRHRSDAWEIKRENGNSFYEFNSSRLTNQHVHGTMKEALFSYNKKQSFGFVTIDTTAKDPTVRYEVVTIDGETVHTIDLKKSQFPNAK